MNPMKRVAARDDHELTVATRNVKDFGGWTQIADQFFDDDGIYSVAIAQVQGQ